MVLGTINASKERLQTASWPRHICAANFLFFGLPYASDHNSDKSRDHSIGISNSSSVNRFQWRFSLVKNWFFYHLFWNNGHREFKICPCYTMPYSKCRLLIWSTGNLDKQHVTKAIICCDFRAFQYPFVLCDTFLLSALCFIRVGRVWVASIVWREDRSKDCRNIRVIELGKRHVILFILNLYTETCTIKSSFVSLRMFVLFWFICIHAPRVRV